MGLCATLPGVGEGTFLHLSKSEHLSSPLAAQGPSTEGKRVSYPAFVQYVFSELLLGSQNKERFLTESISLFPAVKTTSQLRCFYQHCTNNDCFLEERLYI